MTVVAERLKDLLDERMLCYELIPHATDFTALETAEHTHISGNAFAKAVIVFADQRLLMAVVPASRRVDLDVLKKYLNAERVKLAREWRIRRYFPDCEPGAIPPLGEIYDLIEFMCPLVAENDCIAFNAGSHEMVCQLSYADYRRVARPILVPGLSKPWQNRG